MKTKDVTIIAAVLSPLTQFSRGISYVQEDQCIFKAE
jgi:hypothetical protein